MSLWRILEVVVLAALLLAFAAFVLADRRAVGDRIAEVRALVEAEAKQIDETKNEVRFLVLRVEDLEKDVRQVSDNFERHLQLDHKRTDAKERKRLFPRLRKSKQ